MGLAGCGSWAGLGRSALEQPGSHRGMAWCAVPVYLLAKLLTLMMPMSQQ